MVITYTGIIVFFMVMSLIFIMRTSWIAKEMSRRICDKHVPLNYMRPLLESVIMFHCWDMDKLIDERKDRSPYYEKEKE